MTHWLLTLLLGPLLLYQGFRVRKNILLLPEPPGEQTGTAGSGPLLRLLVTGDSAAAGVGAAHQQEALLGQLVTRLSQDFRVEFTLLAKTGGTTRSSLRDVKKLSGQSFDAVVISLGVNDVTAGVGLTRWREQQAGLRTYLRESLGTQHLIVTGLPPVHGFPALPQPLRWYLGRRASEFDTALQQDVAAEPDVQFVSLRFSQDVSLMAIDGFHPGPAIYREWARRAADQLRAAYGARA